MLSMSSKLHHTCHVRKEVAERGKISKLLKMPGLEMLLGRHTFVAEVYLKLLNNMSDLRALMLKYVT